jgi:alpha-glucosidase (family GH31 glycosyl hydrolase)
MADVQLEGGLRVRVNAVGPGSFRIRATIDEGFSEPALVRYGVVSLPPVDAECSEQGQQLEVKSSAATLSIDRADGTIRLAGRDGAQVVSSVGGLAVSPGCPTELAFGLSPDERLYGFGDINRDRIQRRGQRIDVWVRNVFSYAPIPFVMSSAGWGLLALSTRKQTFDLGASDDGILRLSSLDPAVDVVLFAADSMIDVLSASTALIGRPMLLPQWAYGLTFACNQQADAREMLEDALHLRDHDIPCDVIGLEVDWMQTRYDYSTEKRWDPERFHIPHWMLVESKNTNWGDGKDHTFFGALDRLGYKLSLWLCCDYDLSFEAERRASTPDEPSAAVESEWTSPDDIERDERLQRKVMMDEQTKPDEAWFEHLKQFVDQGVSGFKLDGANQVLDHPDRAWGNGMRDDEMHNLYPVLLGQQMQDGFAEHTGRRALVYTAGGYTGIAQYAATWAGDTGGGPRPVVSMLNHGLSGHSNTSCDMLVFSPEGIHFGFLQPWSQITSWAYWRHPWLLGEKLEAVFRDYAKLRYRLLPYIYSMAYAASQTGVPILRAMPLMYPEDRSCDNLLTHYMLGDSLLVGAFTTDVHLPAGEWTDYWTGERHLGPADITVAPPENRGGPLFVKSGAILPTWPDMSYVGHRSVERIGLDIYLGADGSITLYEDDGDTLAHKSGAWATTSVRCVDDGSHATITIDPRQGSYAGMPQRRTFEVTVHAGSDSLTVDVDGRASSAEKRSPSAATVVAEEDPHRAVPIVIHCATD